MTNTKKMTKKDYFATIRSYIETTGLTKLGEVPADEVLAFIDHEVELLSKKNSAEKKPTAVQVANEGIKQAIVNGMEPDKLYTITDIIKSVPECADLTNQRVSALVRQLMPEYIERVEEKRKAYFRLVQSIED